jgi:WD40 repeat protein
MLMLHGHTGKVRTLAYSPDGRKLASGGSDEAIKLWDLAGRREHATLVPDVKWQQEPVTAVQFVLGGRFVASVSERRGWSEKGMVRLWDVDTGRPTTSFLGQVEASPRDDYDALGFRPVKFAGVAFDPLSQLLATGSTDSSVKFWSLREVCKRVPFWGHEHPVRCVAFAPDGRLLASGSGDHTVRLWDVSTGGLVRATLGHRGAVNAVAFSPDGRTLAAATGSCVKLWDVARACERGTLRGHEETVTGVAFAPDGGTLLTGSWDRTVRLWDAGSGRERACLNWDIGRVHCVAFSPDGMTAAAGGDRPGIIIWDVDGAVG